MLTMGWIVSLDVSEESLHVDDGMNCKYYNLCTALDEIGNENGPFNWTGAYMMAPSKIESVRAN